MSQSSVCLSISQTCISKIVLWKPKLCSLSFIPLFGISLAALLGTIVLRSSTFRASRMLLEIHCPNHRDQLDPLEYFFNALFIQSIEFESTISSSASISCIILACARSLRCSTESNNAVLGLPCGRRTSTCRQAISKSEPDSAIDSGSNTAIALRSVCVSISIFEIKGNLQLAMPSNHDDIHGCAQKYCIARGFPPMIRSRICLFFRVQTSQPELCADNLPPPLLFWDLQTLCMVWAAGTWSNLEEYPAYMCLVNKTCPTSWEAMALHRLISTKSCLGNNTVLCFADQAHRLPNCNLISSRPANPATNDVSWSNRRTCQDSTISSCTSSNDIL